MSSPVVPGRKKWETLSMTPTFCPSRDSHMDNTTRWWEKAAIEILDSDNVDNIRLVRWFILPDPCSPDSPKLGQEDDIDDTLQLGSILRAIASSDDITKIVYLLDRYTWFKLRKLSFHCLVRFRITGLHEPSSSQYLSELGTLRNEIKRRFKNQLPALASQDGNNMTKWLLRPCEIEREPLSDPSAALSYIFDPVDNIFFTEKDIISALHRLSILEMRFQGHITDRIPFWTGFAFFDGIRHNNLDTLADSIIQTSGILFGPSSDIASINMEWEKLRLDAQACIVANCTLLTSIMEIEMRLRSLGDYYAADAILQGLHDAQVPETSSLRDTMSSALAISEQPEVALAGVSLDPPIVVESSGIRGGLAVATLLDASGGILLGQLKGTVCVSADEEGKFCFSELTINNPGRYLISVSMHDPSNASCQASESVDSVPIIIDSMESIRLKVQRVKYTLRNSGAAKKAIRTLMDNPRWYWSLDSPLSNHIFRVVSICDRLTWDESAAGSIESHKGGYNPMWAINALESADKMKGFKGRYDELQYETHLTDLPEAIRNAFECLMEITLNKEEMEDPEEMVDSEEMNDSEEMEDSEEMVDSEEMNDSEEMEQAKHSIWNDYDDMITELEMDFLRSRLEDLGQKAADNRADFDFRIMNLESERRRQQQCHHNNGFGLQQLQFRFTQMHIEGRRLYIQKMMQDLREEEHSLLARKYNTLEKCIEMQQDLCRLQNVMDDDRNFVWPGRDSLKSGVITVKPI